MENVYANNIPALPPLAAGVDDGPAPAIAQGEPLAFQDVTAAHRQHRNRKRLAKNDPALVTGDELVASKRRKHTVQSSNFDGPTPAWAKQMEANMERRFEQVSRRFDLLSRRLDLENERGMNRSRRSATDRIVSVLRMEDGMKPNVAPFRLWFPRNQAALVGADEVRLNALLDFYGLGQEGNDMEKKLRLMSHLGVIVL
jgi:hypothetical protein